MVCSSCNKDKTLESYHLRKDTSFGYRKQCKICRIIKQVQRDRLNPEPKRRRDKKYRQSELGKKKERIRNLKYVKTDKGKAGIARRSANRRSRLKETINDLTHTQWKQILIQQKNKCKECDNEFGPNLVPQRDHIVPLFLGGSLTKNNVQALCKSCNSTKGTKLIEIN